MAAKAQRSHYFPISTSRTNINTESLTFLTCKRGSQHRTSCRKRPMMGMGGISSHRAAVPGDPCASTAAVGGRPWRCAAGQWGNAGRTVTDLASPPPPRRGQKSSNPPALSSGPQEVSILSGRKATAIITQPQAESFAFLSHCPAHR